MSIVKELHKKGLITPPKFLPDNIHYETMMGSIAYGVSSDSSDTDIYGFCIPPKDSIFPHLRGEILGFGTQINRFEQYQQHHIEDKNARVMYDITIYSIVKYFQLCLENNPNLIDSLFTPARCVRHSTKIGNLVRENRTLFLHKGCWHKFRGYAWSQLHKMESQNRTGKRQEMIEQYGYDVKFGYHVVRLLGEVEQILSTGDLDLERDREVLKAIRRGEWNLQKIKDWFSDREHGLQTLYENSTLPHSPDEAKIKNLLLACLEEHYGSLSNSLVIPDQATQVLHEIKALIEKHGF
jgi:predicted nucleotidyltransferase